MISTLNVSPIFSKRAIAASRDTASRRNVVFFLTMPRIDFSMVARSSSVNVPPPAFAKS